METNKIERGTKKETQTKFTKSPLPCAFRTGGGFWQAPGSERRTEIRRGAGYRAQNPPLKHTKKLERSEGEGGSMSIRMITIDETRCNPWTRGGVVKHQFVFIRPNARSATEGFVVFLCCSFSKRSDGVAPFRKTKKSSSRSSFTFCSSSSGEGRRGCSGEHLRQRW